MKFAMTLAVTLVTLLSFTTSATILPPNDLHLEDNLFTDDANMTEAEFNQIIDDVMAAYTGIVSGHGGNLQTNKLWTDSTVNASASQRGSSWIVNMYGGLARRPEVTKDGFAMVVCHELGHHLAGFPFYDSGWAASEGESDYFATQACAKKIWGTRLQENAELATAVHPIAKSRCDGAWEDEAERNLCYRTAMAGESLAKLLSALGGTTASFETPDTNEVSSTKTSHPAGQCRLDTYFSGALCKVEFDEAVIPGRRHAEGQQSVGAETEAAKYSCTRAAFHSDGLRPRCWYKPQLQSLLKISSVSISDRGGNKNGAIEPNERIRLLVHVENLANKAYENVTGTLSFLGDKFKISRGTAEYGDIASKSSKRNRKEFKIRGSKQLTCGEEVEMNLTLNIGEGKEATLKHPLLIGKLVETAPLTLAANQNIPDKVAAGIDSVIGVSLDGNFSKAKLKVDISHTYIGDLVVTLKSPTGEHFEVHKRAGGSADDIKKTYDLDLPAGSQITGDWTLNVADFSTRDTGVLNLWELQFTKSVCEALPKKRTPSKKKPSRKKTKKKKRVPAERCADKFPLSPAWWLCMFGA